MKAQSKDGWEPDYNVVLRTIISVDPRPDSVEDVLIVCPQQAALFGGLHLRLVWIHSLVDASQGWSGREGLARVRVNTALRPQDPAVLIMPGSAEAAKDPIVDLRAHAVPPHYVLPWATIEMVLPGEGARGIEFAFEMPQSSSSSSSHSDSRGPTSALRPAAALELLRGSVVRSGGSVHLMASPTDPAYRRARLLCRRAPEFFIPDSGFSRDGKRDVGVRSHTARDNDSARNEQYLSGSCRFRAGERRGRQGGGHREEEEEESGAAGTRGYDDEGDSLGAGTTRRRRERLAPEKGDGDACPREDGGGSSSSTGGSAIGRNGRGGEGCSGVGLGVEGTCFVRRLREWGVVTACSEIVVPHEALEVRYHDLLSMLEEETSGEPALVGTVLRSHPSSVVDDLCANLELTPPQNAASVSDDEPIRSFQSGGVGGGGGGALLVHGPPGVGKTCLVEAVARRLRCRLVKVSPGRLAAAAGVHADRILDEAFRYSRMCVSGRVLLLLDSIDRLTPAAGGGVGATRGDVDVGVLNTFVLAVEKGRRDPSWRGRVAVVSVTSWPEQVHPTARRCANREVLIPLPSQSLRSRILRNALQDNLREWEIEHPENSETQEAFEGVTGLCQGFTAGDMCAVAAAALSYLRGGRDRSRGEALREAFRQVQSRASFGRGGAGGGGSASVSGVPNVRWSEVGGLERAKRAVREMVVWPSRHPEAFRRMGITPASGVLLFGPPGTGKTLLAKAAATETGATFIELKVSDVVRGEVGESEKVIERAFRTARELAPSIVFIDEFQALFASRDVEGATSSRLASQLLVCMDELGRWKDAGTLELRDAAHGKDGSGESGSLRPDANDHSDFDAGEVKGELPSSLSAGLSGEEEAGSVKGVARTWEANVMVLAATNAPEGVDAAFLRPGRFDEIVYAGLPDDEGRRQILRAAKVRMEGAVAPIPAAEAQATPAMEEYSAVKEKDEQMTPSADATSTSAAPRVGEEIGTSLVMHTEDSVAMSPQSSLLETPTQKGGGNVVRWASDVDEAWLSRKTQGYSGADLTSLVRNATMAALRDQEEGRGGAERRHYVSIGRSVSSNSGRGLLVLARRHFETALATTQPSSGLETVARHESWARQWHTV